METFKLSKSLFALLVVLYCTATTTSSPEEVIYGHLLAMDTNKCQLLKWKCADYGSCSFIETNFEDCRCDPQCAVYRDCCYERGECTNGETAAAPDFQCHNPVPRGPDWEPRHDVTFRFKKPWNWFWMVIDCPRDWIQAANDQALKLHQTIQDKCNSKMYYRPVSDKATGFDYRNEYCALCNGVQAEHILHWGYEYECFGPSRSEAVNTGLGFLHDVTQTDVNITQSVIDNYCNLSTFTRPVFKIGATGVFSNTPRYCFPTQPRTCIDHPSLQRQTRLRISEEDYNILKANCEHGTTQGFVATSSQSEIDYPYSNPFCALCNGYRLEDLRCYEERRDPDIGISIVYSIFLDINQDGQLTATSDVLTKTSTFTCSKNEVYDPFLKACRSTVIRDCYSENEHIVESVDEEICDISCNGSLISLDINSFACNGSNTTLVYQGELYDIEFTNKQGEPVVCVDFGQNGTINQAIPMYPIETYILTYVGCSLSVVGCLLVLLTNLLFKELRSLPTKLLMNLAVAILVTNLLLILGIPVIASFPENKDLCVSTAILLHFFSLSQFSWMCVLSVEVVHSFYIAYKMIPKDNFKKDTKLLICYIIIGWTVPVVITTITIIMNFFTDLVWYGVTENGDVGRCWINHSDSLIISFIVPVGVAITFNLIAFVIVCVLLIQARCLQRKLHIRTRSIKFPYFRASIAIFTVSGITWIFGFIGLLPQSQWAWYPFTVLNSVQGLLIFLAFLCTKKVGKLYLSLLCRKKYKKRQQSPRQTQATNPTRMMSQRSIKSLSSDSAV